MTELRVDWCSYEAAKYAVMHWHYSKRMPKSRQLYIGVWEEGEFIGSIVFGKSITPYLGNAFGLTQWECSELTRVALTDHAEHVSRIVSKAMGKLSKKNEG